MRTRAPSLAILIALAAGLVGARLLAAGDFVSGSALLLGSVVALRWAGYWQVEDPPELRCSTRLYAVGAVVLVAAFFRFHRMVPPGLWGDDAINGLLALDLLDGKITSPFQLVSHSQSRFPALSTYPVAGAFWLLGPGLATLRLPGVLLNLLCVPLVYGTFASLFHARVALIAALLFATSAVQLSHGKILIQASTGECLHLLGMFFLVRGLTGPRRWLLALAGVPLGLSLLTYHSYKLGPLVAVIAIAAWLIANRRRREARAVAAWSAAGLLLLVAAAAPGFAAYAADPSALTARIGGTSVLREIQAKGSLWPLWDSIWRTLAIFHYQQGPVLYHWFGIGTHPALNPIVGFLAVHGLVQSLRHWKEPGYVLLLGWFAIGLVPGLLSSEAPRIYRVLLATPPLFVWAALPVERLLAWAAMRRSRVAAALAGVILLAVPLFDFNYYFYRVYTSPEYQWMQATRIVDMAQTLRAYGPGWKGHLFSSGYDAEHETLQFLRRIWRFELVDAESLGDVMPLRGEENALLLFDPSTIQMVEAVRTFYPAATRQMHWRPSPRWSWFDPLLFDVDSRERRPLTAHLPVPRLAAESVRGVTAFLLGADGSPLGTRVRPQLSTGFDASEPPPAAVALSGALYAPASGIYEFTLTAPGAAAVRLDGEPLVSNERPQASVELVQGLHPFTAIADAVPTASLELRWRPPGGEESAPIPASLLYRDSDVHGWVADYTGRARQFRRLEPVPWYGFFRPPLDGPYNVRWRGRLRVPDEGRFLVVHARGELHLTIGGKQWERDQMLAPGIQDVELRLEEVQGPLALELVWREAHGLTAPVMPADFLPPGRGQLSQAPSD